MHAGSPKLRSDANRIHPCPTSARMRGVMGQPIRGADMHPPALCSHAHAGLVLMQHRHVHTRHFELVFHLVERLMAGFHKTGETACGELHAKQIVKQLARTSVRHSLPLNQRDCQGLDAGARLNGGFNCRRKKRSGQMSALGTLLFFDAMLCDPEALGWQIDHLATLGNGSGAGAQIPLAMRAVLYRMYQHGIWLLDRLEVMPPMAWLPAWLFAAFLLEALGATHEPIRRRR